MRKARVERVLLHEHMEDVSALMKCPNKKAASIESTVDSAANLTSVINPSSLLKCLARNCELTQWFLVLYHHHSGQVALLLLQITICFRISSLNYIRPRERLRSKQLKQLTKDLHEEVISYLQTHVPRLGRKFMTSVR